MTVANFAVSPIAAPLLAGFFNRRLSPHQRQLLRRHSQNTVAVQTRLIKMVCRINNDGALVAVSPAIDADAVVYFSAAKIKLFGDADLLRDFTAACPTLESVLTEFFGETTGAKIAATARRFPQTIRDKLLRPIIVADKGAMDDFCRRVRALNKRAATLQRQAERQNG